MQSALVALLAVASPPEVLTGTREEAATQQTCTTSLLLELHEPPQWQGTCAEWHLQDVASTSLELVVFSLDNTLWYPQLDQLKGGPPFELVDGGLGGVLTSEKERLDLFPAARRALMDLADNEIAVAIASTPQKPDWALELLQLIMVDEERSVADVIGEMPIEIGYMTKQQRFELIRTKTGIGYGQMLCFDNKVADTSDLLNGVPQCQRTPMGLTQENFAAGLRAHAALAADGSRRRLSADDPWFSAWCGNVQRWWSSLGPLKDDLGACFGAFSLHLGSRLDAALRSRFPGAAPPLAAAGAGEANCEWVRSPETLALPELPAFPEDWSQFSLPPIPRLLPELRWLQSQSQHGLHEQIAQADDEPAVDDDAEIETYDDPIWPGDPRLASGGGGNPRVGEVGAPRMEGATNHPRPASAEAASGEEYGTLLAGAAAGAASAGAVLALAGVFMIVRSRLGRPGVRAAGGRGCAPRAAVAAESASSAGAVSR